MTSIEQRAFYYSGLTSVKIPHGVQSIGNYAFSRCEKLTKIIVDERNSWYRSIDGNLYTEDGEKLILYATGKQSTLFEMPTGVKSIGNYAFSRCKNLQKVIVADTVKNISFGAFAWAESITEIYIPDGVESIGTWAFCYCYNLMSVTIPDSVTTVGGAIFYGSRSITAYCEASKRPSGWDEGWCSTHPVVWNCRNNDVANDGYSYVYAGGLKYSLKDGEARVWYQSLTIVEANVLSSITYNNKVYKVTKICDFAFYSCEDLTTVNISDSVTTIGSSAFVNCHNLAKVTMGNGVNSIGESAFKSCHALVDIFIPNGVEKIGANTFYGCYSLQKINMPMGVKIVDDQAFAYCYGLKEVIVGKNVTTIGNYAFCNCYALEEVIVPLSVTTVGEYAFDNCKSLIIYCEATASLDGWVDSWNYFNCPVVWDCKNNDVANDGYVYLVKEGLRYGIKGNEAIVVRQVENIVVANVADNIIYLGDTYAVTSIDKHAFSACYNLTTVTIGNNVKNIKTYAFEHCKSLTSVTIGDGVVSIDEYAFSECERLEEIIIPYGVKSIGKGAFEHCESLTKVVVAMSVETIGYMPFVGCRGLVVYCQATSAQSGWDSCWNLNNPVVWDCDFNDVADDGYVYVKQNGVNYGIKYGMAIVTKQASNIVSAEIATRVEYNNKKYYVNSIGESAFEYCDKLTDVVLSNSLNSIGDHAFSGCDGLTSIVIPSSITSIGYGAFAFCKNLTHVYYLGDAVEWAQIRVASENSCLLDATTYFFSKKQPMEEGNYWYYDTDGKTPLVWKKQD